MTFRRVENFPEGEGLGYIPSASPDSMYLLFYVSNNEYLVSSDELDTLRSLVRSGNVLESEVGDYLATKDNIVFRVISRNSRKETGVVTDVKATPELCGLLYQEYLFHEKLDELDRAE